MFEPYRGFAFAVHLGKRSHQGHRRWSEICSEDSRGDTPSVQLDVAHPKGPAAGPKFPQTTYSSQDIKKLVQKCARSAAARSA